MCRKNIFQFISTILLLSFCGCVSTSLNKDKYTPKNPTYTWKSNPSVQSFVSEKYDINISPYGCESSFYYHDNGCSGINLTVTNKTNRDINLVWDQTYFIDNGQTNGTFMFEGVVYSRRNDKKPNDIIFANSTFQKVIFPSNRVELTRARGWRNTAMRDGKWGVYLTFQIDGQIFHEKLTYSISHE